MWISISKAVREFVSFELRASLEAELDDDSAGKDEGGLPPGLIEPYALPGRVSWGGIASRPMA